MLSPGADGEGQLNHGRFYRWIVGGNLVVADHFARHGLADFLGVLLDLLPGAGRALEPQSPAPDGEVVQELLPLQPVPEVVGGDHVVVQVDAVEHLQKISGS